MRHQRDLEAMERAMEELQVSPFVGLNLIHTLTHTSWPDPCPQASRLKQEQDLVLEREAGRRELEARVQDLMCREWGMVKVRGGHRLAWSCDLCASGPFVLVSAIESCELW